MKVLGTYAAQWSAALMSRGQFRTADQHLNDYQQLAEFSLAAPVASARRDTSSDAAIARNLAGLRKMNFQVGASSSAAPQPDRSYSRSRQFCPPQSPVPRPVYCSSAWNNSRSNESDSSSLGMTNLNPPPPFPAAPPPLHGTFVRDDLQSNQSYRGVLDIVRSSLRSSSTSPESQISPPSSSIQLPLSTQPPAASASSSEVAEFGEDEIALQYVLLSDAANAKEASAVRQQIDDKSASAVYEAKKSSFM